MGGLRSRLSLRTRCIAELDGDRKTMIRRTVGLALGLVVLLSGTLSFSAAAAPAAATPTPTPPPPHFMDGRLNSHDPAQSVALWCTNNGVEVDTVYNGQGYFAFLVSP